MKVVYYRLVCILLLCAHTMVYAESGEGLDTESKLKVGFVYNFMKFVEWPPLNDPNLDPNAPFVVGLVGDVPIASAFELITHKEINGRPIEVVHFDSIEAYKTPEDHPDLEAIQLTQLIFIGASESPFLDDFLKLIQKHPILTISDTKEFLERGVIINLFMEEDKVRFGVNTKAASRARLVIRSKLLRLAKERI